MAHYRSTTLLGRIFTSFSSPVGCPPCLPAAAVELAETAHPLRFLALKRARLRAAEIRDQRSEISRQKVDTRWLPRSSILETRATSALIGEDAGSHRGSNRSRGLARCCWCRECGERERESGGERNHAFLGVEGTGDESGAIRVGSGDTHTNNTCATCRSAIFCRGACLGFESVHQPAWYVDQIDPRLVSDVPSSPLDGVRSISFSKSSHFRF